MKASIVATVLLAGLATARPTYQIPEDFPAPASAIQKRQLGKGGLGGCKEVTLIFCRGTFEPGGPVGLLVGGPFSSALGRALPGKLETQGVNYDAGVVGYLIGGDPAGANTMAKMVSQKIANCPNTKIVMGGYSQGAQVTHMAAAKLKQDEKDKVVAIVVFGDPMKGKAIPGIPSDRIHTQCAPDDPICMGLPIPLGSHLGYGGDAKGINGAVNHVKTKVESGGGGGGGGSGISGLLGKGKDSAPKGKDSAPKGKDSGAKGGAKGKGGAAPKSAPAPKGGAKGKGGAPKESSEEGHSGGHDMRTVEDMTIEDLM